MVSLSRERVNTSSYLRLHVILSVFYPSLMGIIIAPIAMLVTQAKLLLTEIEAYEWCLIVFIGCVSFFGLILMCEALQVSYL